MTLALPRLHVGEPIRHDELSVFPLLSEDTRRAEYQLADEALAGKSVTVEEVSTAGSVPELLVENKGDVRVLFLEGEELVGAKQNRVLNTSVLVAAQSRIKIPVSCVEQGRWRASSQYFASSGSHSSSMLRAILKRSVSRSLKGKGGHRSDQGAVWRQIAALQEAQGVESPTAAMADVYAAYTKRIAEFRERLQYVQDAQGMAVAIGSKIAMLDVFDQPKTCERVWSRLLSGVVFDALSASQTEGPATIEVVERFLTRMESFAWERTDAVGEGEEYRSDAETGEHASTLVLDAVIVHCSVVAAL